jgi:hypothetical protein
MTEAGVTDYYIDPEVRARYTREAELLRAELLRKLLVSLWTQLTRLGATTGRLARSAWRRRAWNLSLPAPHR